MKLLESFIRNELDLDPGEYLQIFRKYEKLLLEWNKKINLISRKSVSIEEHILNSIFFLPKINFKNVNYLADVGTGGGFPGIPLKIFFPHLNIMLLDSIKKKINVLQDIIEKMQLKNIQTICGRAEEISMLDNFRNRYDIVISKSVTTLSNIYEWTCNFPDKDGRIFCIKGGDIDNEIESLKKMKYNNITIVVMNFDYENYGIRDKKLVILKSNH